MRETYFFMTEIVDYIKSFLLYGSTEAAAMVGYTADEKEWSKYKIVIVPNGKLGKEIVMPSMENPKTYPLPLPFKEGSSKHNDDNDNENDNDNRNKVYVVEEDIIYNTFFFISRAEELICDKRDEHGRFAAKYSILGEKNRMQIPIVDEYARFLTKTLERICTEAGEECPTSLPKQGFSAINLTHDIDTIDQYRRLRGALGGIRRGEWRDVLASQMDINNDPVYTFPWLMEQDEMVRRHIPETRMIYFVKHTKGRGLDYPQYCLHGRDYKALEQMLVRHGASIGLHSSYYGEIKQPMALHRSHYLRCSIKQMQCLVDFGVTDDYTMGFADVAGFRLQTCRPVRWINPETMTLTPLTLHPLTVMDCTLSRENYMNLSEDEAFYYTQRLIDKVRQNGGELTLLWHNSNMGDEQYHQQLYSEIIKYLCEE